MDIVDDLQFGSGRWGDIRQETVLFSRAFFIDVVDDLQFWDGGWGGGGFRLETVHIVDDLQF